MVAALVALAVAGASFGVPIAAGADPGPPPGIPAPPPSRTLDDPARDGAGDDDAGRTTAWQRALDDANGSHVDEVVEPRPLAAIIGTIWFALALRSRWRARRRTRPAA